MPADGAGIRFGQYLLLRRIARGGMAEVFLARQRGFEGFDRRVAIKRILPHLADAPDFIKMFLGEAQLAAQLAHPNIVHIYEFGKVDSDYFIAMEYVDGVHAGELSKHGGDADRPSPAMVARLGADAAAALHYAHELRTPSGKPVGLVHRDVSPPNLMVSFDGVVKLCDFGIAKAAAIGDRLTNPGQVKGKYAYMSPEQTTGEPLDGRSDVFSLGIVLWELLTGRTIVPRGDAVEAMRAIRDGKLTPIDRAAPGTPPALAHAITWALQTRREHRPTAMELAQGLEAFIKSSPELATPLQVGGWLRARFTRESTDEVGSLPTGTQVVAVAALTPGPRSPAEPPSSDPQIAAALMSFPSVSTSDTTSEMVALARAHRSVQGAAVALPNPAAAPPVPPVPPADPAAGPPGSLPVNLAAQAPTMIPLKRAADASTIISADRGALVLTDLSGATRIYDAAAAVPTILDPRPPSLTRGSPRAGMPTQAAMPARSITEPMRRRRAGLAVASMAVLVVVVLVIALARRDRSPPTTARRDPRTAIAAAPGSGDAQVDLPAALPPDAPPPDAPAPTSPTIPTIPPDTTTILEVRTRPEHARVTVSDYVRVAPTQFTLPAGHYAIDAELDGWMPERRSVDLVAGERVVQEIVFTTRLVRIARRPQTGKLSVRTTPPYEVYLGTRRLTETPFSELALEPATYTLVFKHPQHATVIKHVTITAGKTTKLSFALP